MKNINDVKTLIPRLCAKKHIVFNDDEWSADYKIDWESELSKLMSDVVNDIEKLIKGVESDDDVLSVAAITMARIRFLKLSDFFLDIHEDFERLLSTDEIEWPKIGDDYNY
ncbi:hypothetical protein NVV30_25785 [Pseudomonas syringae]|uniref:hypothetical protein n=1 Tax=Pseudomonas syringae TaxID=317 RepID=UPI00215B5582|nr:hypothetical protein [Pseudomonas syringae]MCR8722091.1 hypothetical protein [Pseudomonas syringae]